MGYKWSVGQGEQGDIVYSSDLDQDTKIDFEEDQIKLVANGTEYVTVGTGSINVNLAGTVGVDEYIYHNGDADTYIKFGNDNINFKVGNRTLVTAEIKSSSPHEVTINDGGNNVDFVVKGNGSNEGNPLFKCDASTGRVGINGVGSPDCELHIDGDLKVVGNDPRIKIDGDVDSHPGLEFFENGTRKGIIFNNYGDDSLDFKTNSTTRMVINQDGTVGIGTQSPSTTLDVDGTTKSNFYTTTVTTQDLGNGTSSTLSTTSGIVLLDADSITGNDMGGGVEAHTLIFPTPSVSGQKLTIIAQNANTNSTFILPVGLISGSYQSLHDASGISAVTFVQIVEGSHKAWYQV